MLELQEIYDIYLPGNLPNRATFIRRLEKLIEDRFLKILGEHMIHATIDGEARVVADVFKLRKAIEKL